MTDTDRIIDYMALSSLPGLNVRMAEEILARLDSIADFFSMSEAELSSAMGFRNRIFDKTMRSDALDDARSEWEFVSHNNIRVHLFDNPDSGYPLRLAECDDAPVVLFSIGNADLNDGRFMSVVGTRHATAYGVDFTRSMVEQFSATLEEKFTVISGLAFGIDVAAHLVALEVGVPTIAVVAHGLNTIYPAAHRNIAARIVKEGGALVTEYRSCDAVFRNNFLARNRLVAGMADATVVIESDLKGGAMSTAHMAQDYNRDVFALPGRVTDRFSRGTNHLIASNRAAIVTDPQTLLHSLGWRCRKVEAMQQELFAELPPDRKQVVDFLRYNGQARLADLKSHTGLTVARLLSLLSEMEFDNLVRSLPGGVYILATHI